jgi:DNA-binding transcriptional ArsR family regulator
VLASSRRLACLSAVLTHPDGTVEELAGIAGVPVDQASLCLRALQARGLISPQRHSRWVRYSPLTDPLVPSAAPVLAAMRRALLDDKMSAEAVTGELTAFTHLRRLAVLRVLGQHGSLSPERLSVLTQISPPALLRHLNKLLRHGLVRHERRGKWSAASAPSQLAKALLALIR